MLETTVQRLLIRGRSPATIVRPTELEAPWPEVTVVIPCYNYGRFLEESVASVLTQAKVDVRVLVIDDASQDDSGEVAERIAGRDDRVSVIRHHENMGHIATYNEGLRSVETEFVALLSADDMLTPGSLSRATGLMREFPSVGFVYGRPVVFTGDAPPKAARTRARTWTVWKGADWLSDRYRLGRNAIWAPEAVMRTETLKRCGLFDPDHPHSGDLHLWLRMAQISDVGLLSGCDQGFYREHSSSMSRTTFAGELTDLEARRETFREAVMSRPNGGELYQLAAKALAREALRTAAAARRDRDRHASDDLIAFARSTWRTADLLPEAQFIHEEERTTRSRIAAISGEVRVSARGLKGRLRGNVRTWRSHVTGV